MQKIANTITIGNRPVALASKYSPTLISSFSFSLDMVALRSETFNLLT